MERLIAGGTGFLGQALVNQWLASGYNVSVISQDVEKVRRLFGEHVKGIDWTDVNEDFLPELKKYQVVVNLAGANIAKEKWTEERKEDLLISRIETTKKLAGLCAQLGSLSPPLFNASGIGVYGPQTPDPVGLPEAWDESTNIDFSEKSNFLTDLAREWEQATQVAEQAHVRVVRLRLGAVLSRMGGMLPLMARPFKFYLGGPVGSGQQPFSWITLIDFEAIIEFLLQNTSITGSINVVSPGCVTQKQFARALGRALKKPSYFKTPAFILEFLCGELAEELILSGQHIKPSRLKELGYTFRHPTIDSALQSIYSNIK